MNKFVDPHGNTDEDVAAAVEKIRLVNEDAKLNWRDRAWREDMAQEMTDTIYRGFQHESLLDLYTTVENAPFDGRVFVKEVRGLRAFWVARGGYIEASNVHAEVMEIPRDTIGFHVWEFEDKIQTNFAETTSTLVDLGIQRMDATVNQRVFAAFQAAVTSASPYYSTSAGLSLAQINAQLRRVRDTSQTNEVAIIGRATMTDQIVDQLIGTGGATSAFLPQTNEELFNKGFIGTYRGAKVINLINYRDDVDVPFFPANELWVVGNDAAKFAYWGGMLNKSWVEEDNWYWHYIARRDFGGVVHRPDRLGRIVDSSQSPYTVASNISGVEGY